MASKFIRLTEKSPGIGTIYINKDAVKVVYTYEGITRIDTGAPNGTFLVSESMDEVLNLLEDN